MPPTEETGYANPLYAWSLAEFGTPRPLPESGGCILERRIPGTPYQDAMGCYPLFACQDWSRLHVDLEAIGSDLVSLSAVTDPFGEYDPTYLRRCFEDLVVPFKEHFVTELHSPKSVVASRHHRYYARRALRSMHVEKCADPTQFLDDWVKLYAYLSERHSLKGIKAFSRDAFDKQLRVPGLVMLRATSQGETIGAQLWYVQGEVAYSHLTAADQLGYELRATYALYWSAIEYFTDRVRWLDLGAGAGVAREGTDGLSEFKRGWANGSRTAYFCGRVFDPAKYREVSQAKGALATSYFPAYRKGEFE